MLSFYLQRCICSVLTLIVLVIDLISWCLKQAVSTLFFTGDFARVFWFQIVTGLCRSVLVVIDMLDGNACEETEDKVTCSVKVIESFRLPVHWVEKPQP